jgi:hypothetical protein
MAADIQRRQFEPGTPSRSSGELQARICSAATDVRPHVCTTGRLSGSSGRRGVPVLGARRWQVRSVTIVAAACSCSSASRRRVRLVPAAVRWWPRRAVRAIASQAFPPPGHHHALRLKQLRRSGQHAGPRRAGGRRVFAWPSRGMAAASSSGTRAPARVRSAARIGPSTDRARRVASRSAAVSAERMGSAVPLDQPERRHRRIGLDGCRRQPLRTPAGIAHRPGVLRDDHDFHFAHRAHGSR